MKVNDFILNKKLIFTNIDKLNKEMENYFADKFNKNYLDVKMDEITDQDFEDEINDYILEDQSEDTTKRIRRQSKDP